MRRDNAMGSVELAHIGEWKRAAPEADLRQSKRSGQGCGGKVLWSCLHQHLAYVGAWQRPPEHEDCDFGTWTHHMPQKRNNRRANNGCPQALSTLKSSWQAEREPPIPAAKERNAEGASLQPKMLAGRARISPDARPSLRRAPSWTTCPGMLQQHASAPLANGVELNCSVW